MTYMYIFIGGGMGSLARYLISKSTLYYFPTTFPLGTFISNMLACSILAIVMLLISEKSTEFSWIQPLILIGFCGGFSTFSTFSNETVTLMNSGHVLLAIMNILISVAVGVGLVFLIKAK